MTELFQTSLDKETEALFKQVQLIPTQISNIKKDVLLNIRDEESKSMKEYKNHANNSVDGSDPSLASFRNKIKNFKVAKSQT